MATILLNPNLEFLLDDSPMRSTLDTQPVEVIGEPFRFTYSEQTVNEEETAANQDDNSNLNTVENEEGERLQTGPTNNEIFQTSKNGDTVELIQGSEVYVDKATLKAIKSNRGNTHTSLARSLLLAVFKEKALVEHSLSGKGHKSNSLPALPKTVVDTILTFARVTAKKSNWKVHDDVQVKESLRKKMTELKKKNNHAC
ncbi:uncharacterized protein LOC127285954 [Leptopilina boulardi]|uniref:uncharacterized protein LOC127285954 n=1 Tax=Leptopilina boulardi TaxID=63433 RepID=UPI0021F5B6FD|nr:uncharacterized protein LOC127285954 [Leptopilina boulardi]